VWLSERPLDPGRAYLLKHTTRLVPARVEAVRWRLDPETLEEQPAARLELNELGRIAVRCMRPVASDSYADNRATGAFILIDALTNDTVAAGTVVESASGESAREAPGDAQPVSAEERSARLGHRAAIVLAGDERAAAVLERALFDRGCAVTVVRSAEAALGLRSGGSRRHRRDRRRRSRAGAAARRAPRKRCSAGRASLRPGHGAGEAGEAGCAAWRVTARIRGPARRSDVA